MPLVSKNVINMTFTFDFNRLAFFSLSNFRNFHQLLWCLVFGSYSKVLVSSPVMILGNKLGSVWRCLMISWHTCMWCSFWSSVSTLGINFMQTSYMLKSLVIIFQILFISNWLASIWTVNWPLTYTICLTHILCWPVLLKRLTTPEIIFSLLTSLFELFAPLRNVCITYGVISIHLLKHFKCLWSSFPRPDKKFQVYSLLSVHHLFLNAHGWATWKRQCVNKSTRGKKNWNSFRKLKL